MRAALHVRLEVAGIDRQVLLPRPRGVLVVLQLVVDARHADERLAIRRAQTHDLLVLSRRPAQPGIRIASGRLDLDQLREREMRVGVVGVQGHGVLGLGCRVVDTPDLTQQPRRLDEDCRGGRIELLCTAILSECFVRVPGEPCLEPETEVVEGFRAIDGRGGSGGRRGRRRRRRRRRRRGLSYERCQDENEDRHEGAGAPPGTILPCGPHPVKERPASATGGRAARLSAAARLADRPRCAT